ncbi:hypothetical protein BAE44_0005637 [Dichanthelium oligosanthes]|uniref:Uncharacterized protein n=1 Tax=Dichanthelium oligosanthes TaxID=888268 RepID=A0A1E5W7I6_9POAL|nr:hypothetical protein BAE44_0005637 [Dichanthelium oligosanthes]
MDEQLGQQQTQTNGSGGANSKKAAELPAAPLPYEEMLRSAAYERMRAEHPAEFTPASVFFTHDPRSANDRRKSFRVKAALVYEAVTGHHVDDHMTRANSLLLALAKECHSRIQALLAANKAAPRGGGDATKAGEATGSLNSDTNTGSNRQAELTDERWDEKQKRVVDGIFLVVGFLPKLKEAIAKSSDRDGVDETFKSRHMHDIVTDMIKLENQLPLGDLLDVAGVVEAAVKATVDRDEFEDVRGSIIAGEYKLPISRDSFGDVVHGFCWYYSPFSSSKKAAAAASPFNNVATDKDMATRTLLDCLHQSVVKLPEGKGMSATGRPSRMPTARELRRSGVRIQASENGRAEVEFAQSTVRLPALVYDFKLATVARNLLALEYDGQSKPMTRYFQMMNEFVEDAGDVRLLRRAGVVRGGSSGAQEVHDLIKNIDGHATYPSVYMAMDREIEKVRQYHDQRMASFFVRNRPGVIWASSVAAISVVAIVAARRNRASGEGDAPNGGKAIGSLNPHTNKGSNLQAELTDERWDEKQKRVVDGIFLVVGFLPKLKDAIAKSSNRNGVDRTFKWLRMHDIVTDMIKLENQLPLSDLLDVAGVVEDAVKATVDRDEFKDVKDSIAAGEYRLPFSRDSFGDVVHSFCWYYSPFYSSKKAAAASPFKDVATDTEMATRTLLDCLHQSVVKPPEGKGVSATGRPSCMPTARELRRSGVRIQASENGRAEVEFAQPTVRLPALVYDFKLAMAVRNLLALEYEEQSKPMTRYFQMMNELVEDAADVRILRRAGVVRGGSRTSTGTPRTRPCTWPWTGRSRR